MFINNKKNNLKENILYSKILSLSRNKLFYTNLGLEDSFQNRINLVFLHTSFLFIKIRQKNINSSFKNFSQKMFDFIFNQIEMNMRESGHGDITVNKNMKLLVRIFYDILLGCENFRQNDDKHKIKFLLKYLSLNYHEKNSVNVGLVDYFNKYESFCFDLNSDNVLKSDLNFNYK